ncbi:hypothetical protein [uncultured Hymenobacter sp.]|uniref:hypothetical protein n=1 Tax=uncultured Hymenobacter sp. TaxID=170016 RepID=UPI0035CAC61F
MKRLLVPQKTAVVELLDGRKVRIISFDPFSKKVNVKSLATGLPFTTTEDQLRLSQ